MITCIVQDVVSLIFKKKSASARSIKYVDANGARLFATIRFVDTRLVTRNIEMIT